MSAGLYVLGLLRERNAIDGVFRALVTLGLRKAWNIIDVTLQALGASLY